MEFQEELARELIDKHQLSPKTLQVWKYRGKIPKKYADPDYQKPGPLTAHEKHLKKKIIEVLANPKLHLANICEAMEMKTYRLHDWREGKAFFSGAEIKRLHHFLKSLQTAIKNDVKALQRISEERRIMQSEKAKKHFEDILTNPYLHYTTVVREVGMEGHDAYAFVLHIRGVSANSSSLDSERLNRIIDAYAKLVFEIQI